MKRLFVWAIPVLLFACNNEKKEEPKMEDASVAVAVKGPTGDEFGDLKYRDLAKKSFEAMSTGDIDGMTSYYADNAVQIYNSGDSLAGKAAISEYWKNRWKTVLDSLTYGNQIWLPVKVNVSQAQGHLVGNWSLVWQSVWAKYKTGKSMFQFGHFALHFNDADKIDRIIIYLDRAPINAASKK